MAYAISHHNILDTHWLKVLYSLEYFQSSSYVIIIIIL
jgi:hypothetical protein